MTIQLDNSNSGVLTLKPSASGTQTLTLPPSVSASTGFQTNGSGTLTFASYGTAGATFALNTTSPNNTNNVSVINFSGGTTDEGIILAPKGNGSLITAIPDGTTSKGDARGPYSTDITLMTAARSSSASVNKGTQCTVISPDAIGIDSTSKYVTVVNCLDLGVSITGVTNGCFIGNIAVASPQSTLSRNIKNVVSINNGYTNNPIKYDYCLFTGVAPFQNNGTYGVAGGVRGTQGTWIHGNAGQYGATYRSVVYGNSTSATSIVLLPLGDNTQTADNTCSIMGYGVTVFDIYVMATVKTAGGDAKCWRIEGMVTRATTASTTAIVGTNTTTVLGADSGASAWTMTVTANTTYGSVNLNATGAASTNIQWVAYCNFYDAATT